MKTKLRSVIAMLLSLVVVISGAFPVVYASSDVATPSDAAMAGTVVFIPENENSKAYEPEGAGAYGVVYELYDSHEIKAGEFVLSFNGKAYEGTDGKSVVYGPEETLSGKREKVLELKAGRYTLVQSSKLYGTDVAVEAGSRIMRDTQRYTVDVIAGKQTEIKVELINRKEPVDSVYSIATATDARAELSATGTTYWIDGDWCNQSYNDYGNYHIGTTGNVPNKDSSGADTNRVFCTWRDAVGPCQRNNNGRPVPYSKSADTVNSSMRKVIAYYYEVLAKKSDYAAKAGTYISETQYYLSLLDGNGGESPSWAAASQKYTALTYSQAKIGISKTSIAAAIHARYEFKNSEQKVQAVETNVMVTEAVTVTTGSSTQLLDVKVPGGCKLYVYRAGKWIVCTADGKTHGLKNGDRIRLVTSTANGGKTSKMSGTGRYAGWNASYYTPNQLSPNGNRFQPMVKGESSRSTVSLSICWPVLTGSFAMKKQVLSSDGTTSLKDGAVYTMYDSASRVIARFTTQKTGYATISGLSTLAKYSTLKMEDGKGNVVAKKGIKLTGIPEGTYTIKETTTPEGCEAEAAGRHATLNVAATGETLTYYKAAIQSGTAVKWSKATEKSDTWNVHYLATDISEKDPLNLVIQKVDAETGRRKDAGAASLAGAVFKLEYYKGKTQAQATGTPDNTWYIKTVHVGGMYQTSFSKICLIQNNKQYPSDPAPAYVDNEGNFMLEPGSVKITEVTPPEGYLNVDESNQGYIRVSSGGNITYIDDEPSITVYLDGTGNTLYYNNVLDKNRLLIYEPVMRGDIEFDKKLVNEDGSTSPMANVVFKITSKTTGEYHYVVTDSNGHFSSRTNRNTNNTNKNCREYLVTEDGYSEGSIDSSYGLWFTGNPDVDCEDIAPDSVSDDRGALVYDTYIIEEMRCDANRGYVLSKPQEVTVSEDEQLVAVKEAFVNVPYPEITTLAEHYVCLGENVTVKDELHAKWLKADTYYTAKGIVMDKSTGKPAVDGDGELILSTKVFKTPGSVHGYLTDYKLTGEEAIEFTFNSNRMDSTYVIFEYLYEGEDPSLLQVDEEGNIDTGSAMTDDQGNLIAHADIVNNDGSQTFTVPWIETDAFADENGLQQIQATRNTKISDTVTCHGLMEGTKYKLITKAVFNKNGKEVYVKVGDKQLCAQEIFVADSTYKNVTISLPSFDATPYEGCTITVYQWLYLVTESGDVQLVSHTDIDNTRQQIKFVGLHTKAVDPDTDENFTSSVDKVKERIDYAECTNLTIGHEYTLTAYLYDRETGEKVKDSKGRYVIGTKTFVATEENMTVPVTVSYNPVECGLVGKRIVFFEYMKTLGKDVASHADINDEGQSMRHPKLKTTLHESGSAVKVINTKGIISLTDTAKYTELKKGFRFDIVAKFVNAETGKVISIDGKEAVVTGSIDAESEAGTIEMSYSFDIQKSGLIKADGTVCDVVCYEYIYYNGELLYAEEDINNRDQTISIRPISGKLIIHKRELQNREKPVAGVTFMVFKKADTIIPTADTENLSGLNRTQIGLIQSWKSSPEDMYVGTYVTDQDGEIVVEGLTCGDYYVVETETLATYKLCTERPEFTIDGTHDAEITVINEAKVGYVLIIGPESESYGGGSTPNTGDSSPLKLLFMLLAAAIAGMAGILAVKKKKHRKIMLLLTIAGLGMLLAPKVAYAAQEDVITETSTEVYYSEDESTYEFNFDETKNVEGSVYRLDHISYDKKLSSDNTITVTEELTRTSDNVPEDYKAPDKITENGYTYILKDSNVTKESEPIHVYAYKDTDYLTTTPEPEATMKYTYVDKQGKSYDIILPYSRLEALESGYSDTVSYEGVIRGLNYEYIQVGDKMIPASEFALTTEDVRNILREGGYDVELMTDISVSMAPDTYTDAKGNLCRNYTITAKVYGTKYRLHYEDDIENLDTTYKTVDVYVLSSADQDAISKTNSEVMVTATAYYKLQKKETGMTKVQKVVLSTAVILGILLLIALLLYLIKGGRKNTDDKSKRDIKQDYKNL